MIKLISVNPKKRLTYNFGKLGSYISNLMFHRVIYGIHVVSYFDEIFDKHFSITHHGLFLK